MTLENLMAQLTGCTFDYEIIPHEKQIFSVEDGIQYFHIAAGQTAPTLILSTEKGPVALIVRGDQTGIDFEDLSLRLGFRVHGLARRKDLQKMGFTAGYVPLIGHGLPTLVDGGLLSYPAVYGGSGDEHHTLKIDPHALLALNDVIARL